MGDWWSYGERKYGELAAQTLGSKYSYQTWRDAAWVSTKVELSRRRDILPWSVHKEVAGLPPADQERLLAEAASDAGWVAVRIETSRRREVLPWSVHAEVAGLPPADQVAA